MVSRLLTLLAFACCLVAISSFGFFAVDQLAGASLREQRTLSGALPPSTQAAHHTSQPRATIDSIDARLTQPFRPLFASDSQWAIRGGSMLLALLVYGLGLGFIAHYTRGRSGGSGGRGGRPQPYLSRSQ